MRVGDVRKFLPKDDDEQIVIAWWEYGDGEAWPEWLTEEVWNHYCEQIDSGHDWSYEHEAICDHFDSLRQYEPMDVDSDEHAGTVGVEGEVEETDEVL